MNVQLTFNVEVGVTVDLEDETVVAATVRNDPPHTNANVRKAALAVLDDNALAVVLITDHDTLIEHRLEL